MTCKETDAHLTEFFMRELHAGNDHWRTVAEICKEAFPAEPEAYSAYPMFRERYVPNAKVRSAVTRSCKRLGDDGMLERLESMVAYRVARRRLLELYLSARSDNR